MADARKAQVWAHQDGARSSTISRHQPVVLALFDQDFPHTNTCLLPTDERRRPDDLGRVHAIGAGDIEEA